MIVTRKENTIRVEKGDFNLQAQRKDPFGFWEISGQKGTKKLSFEGEYTSLSDAKQQIAKIVAEMIEVDEKELKALA